MDPDDLLCAACGGRVGEARCPTCRLSRERLRPQLPAGPLLLTALLVLLLVLALA